MTLTSTQIKTQLETITFTHPIKRINDYVEKNESHRKYTSIDIANITGQEEVEGEPTTAPIKQNSSSPRITVDHPLSDGARHLGQRELERRARSFSYGAGELPPSRRRLTAPF